jgi:tetratricopeptide (TPR) repeat protein
MHTSSRRSRTRRAAKAAGRRSGGRNAARNHANSRHRTAARRTASSRKVGAPSGSQARSAQPDPRAKAAVRLFAEGTRHFYRQNFSRAKATFEKLLVGAPSDIAARARVRVRLCEQRLSKSSPPPKTPTDYYNLGVAEINARSLDQAIEHLTRADKAAPNRDDIQYALAAARSLEGNADAALEHLKTSISLRTENRYLAQHDDDFESLRSDARFRALMRPIAPAGVQYSS